MRSSAGGRASNRLPATAASLDPRQRLEPAPATFINSPTIQRRSLPLTPSSSPAAAPSPVDRQSIQRRERSVLVTPSHAVNSLSLQRPGRSVLVTPNPAATPRLPSPFLQTNANTPASVLRVVSVPSVRQQQVRTQSLLTPGPAPNQQKTRSDSQALDGIAPAQAASSHVHQQPESFSLELHGIRVNSPFAGHQSSSRSQAFNHDISLSIPSPPSNQQQQQQGSSFQALDRNRLVSPAAARQKQQPNKNSSTLMAAGKSLLRTVSSIQGKIVSSLSPRRPGPTVSTPARSNSPGSGMPSPSASTIQPPDADIQTNRIPISITTGNAQVLSSGTSSNKSFQELIKSVMSENENLQDNFANVSKLDGFEEKIIEELNFKVCSYNKELQQYLSKKRRAPRPDSQISKAIDMANTALQKFLDKLKEYENLSNSPRSLARSEKLLAMKTEISDAMFRLNDGEENGISLVDAINHVKRRNWDNNSRENRVLTPEKKTYYQSFCKKTWQEQLSKLESVEAVTLRDASLDVDQAFDIKQLMDDNGYLKLDEILIRTNTSNASSKNFRQLMLENLPIICLKGENFKEELFIDRRLFLEKPTLMLDLISADRALNIMIEPSELEGREEQAPGPSREEKRLPRPTRPGKEKLKPGPKNRISSDEVLQTIQNFINNHGLAAHSRRRNDESRIEEGVRYVMDSYFLGSIYI